MPHYRDGTRACVDDEVVCFETYLGHPIFGVVTQVLECESCNLTVAIARTRVVPDGTLRVVAIEHLCLSAKDCERSHLCAQRLRAEKEAAAAKREELAGEVQDLLFEEGPAIDEHGDLSG